MDWKTAFAEAFPFGAEVLSERQPPFPMLNFLEVQPQPSGFPLVYAYNSRTVAWYHFTDLKAAPQGDYEGAVEGLGHVRLIPLAEKNRWNFFPDRQS